MAAEFPQAAVARQCEGHGTVALKKDPIPGPGGVLGSIRNDTRVDVIGKQGEYAEITVKLGEEVLRGWVKQTNLVQESLPEDPCAKVARLAKEDSNGGKEVEALLQALFRDGVGVYEYPRHKKAQRIDLHSFHCFTLQRAEVQCEKHTIEEEVAKESRDGGVEFNAFIKPGVGFKRFDGFWIPRELHSFAQNSIVVFICGFNDARYAEEKGGVQQVCKQIDAHVEWYKWFKAKLVFIEMNDGHGNRLPWMTDHFKRLVGRDRDILLERLEFPAGGWASEKYFGDTYHLTKETLLAWFHTKVKPFALGLSQKLKRKHVLFVTDSSFQAHDYQSVIALGDGSVGILLRTLWGDTLRLRVNPKDRVVKLKQQIVDRFGEEWNIKSPREVRLVLHGRGLDDRRTVESYKIRDGNTILLRMQYDGEEAETYFVNCNDFFDARGTRQFLRGKSPPVSMRGGEAYVVPHNGELKRALNVMSKFDDGNNAWLREDGCKGEWAVSFHGTGLHEGATMAEEGFNMSTGLKGIYSSPQLEVALRYAPTVQQSDTLFQVVIQNRVNPEKIQKVPWVTDGSELWVVPHEDDIRPYGIILREVSESPLVGMKGFGKDAGK